MKPWQTIMEPFCERLANVRAVAEMGRPVVHRQWDPSTWHPSKVWHKRKMEIKMEVRAEDLVVNP